MPLSDVEILAELNAGRLLIDPGPGDRIGPSSVDLLLGPELTLLPSSEQLAGITVSPAEVRVMDLLERYGEAWNMSEQGNFKFLPYQPGGKGSIVLGKTLERVRLPNHLAGRIEGKSSLARLGLAVHITAPTIIAGYDGRLTLEMFNAGPFTLELQPGMKIAQLVLEHLGLPPTSGYSGQFQSQQQ